MDRFLLDTSAIFTLSFKEAGAEKVSKILELSFHKEAVVYISFISLTEIYYIVWKRLGRPQAKQSIVDIKNSPLEVIYPYERLLLSVGRIKATYKLSLADSIIAASAEELKAVLVHKDPEFVGLKDVVPQLILPYKK